MNLAISCLLLILAAPAQARSSTDAFTLEDMLASIGAAPEDLALGLGKTQQPYELEIVVRQLKNPAGNLEEAHSLSKKIMSLSAPAGLGDLGALLGVPYLLKMPEAAEHVPSSLPKEARKALAPVIGGLGNTLSSSKRLKAAGLDGDSRRELIDFFRVQLTNKLPDPKRLRKGETWLERDVAILKMVEKFPLGEALSQGQGLLAAVAAAIKSLPAVAPGSWKAGRYIAGGVVIEIGTAGDDVYAEGADLVIDPGGDDVYRPQALASRPGRGRVIIDLGGDDRYLARGFGALASGIFSTEIVVDLKGDDTYISASGSQGAGLFGVGVLWDRSGNDVYQARAFSQGAGAFGVGMLLDDHGTDLYRASYLSQAMGYVQGVGLLRDLQGNDLYTSGFTEPDPRGASETYGQFHQGEVFQSLSQGFGMGWRSFAGGGIGLLLDAKGNDQYSADYFGQGGGYWYGWGILYDGAGNDGYSSRRYAQGAGVHYAVGSLLDLSGNDRYQGWAVSQGCGHDYSVGLLFDAAGDDAYVSEWSNMGMSSALGMGIFRDGGGRDRYSFRENNSGGKADHDHLRNSVGIGLFADSGPRGNFFSLYRSTRAWNVTPFSASLAGVGSISWGIGAGEAEPPSDAAYREADRREYAFLSQRMAHAAALGQRTYLHELLSVAAGWGIHAGIPLLAKRELLKLEPETALPILFEAFNPRSLFGVMSIEEYFHGAGEARAEILNRLKSGDAKNRSRAAYYLGKLRNSKDIPALLEAMKDESSGVRVAAARAFRYIYDRHWRERLPDLAAALETGNAEAVAKELRRGDKSEMLSLVGLSRFASREDWASMAEGWERWTPPEATAQKAAEILIRDKVSIEAEPEALRRYRPEVIKAVRDLYSDPKPSVRMWAATTLGKVGAPPSALVSALDDASYSVRVAAHHMLLERKTQAVGDLVKALESESARQRAEALRVLGRIQEFKKDAGFYRALRDSDRRVRHAALAGLAEGARQGRWRLKKRIIRKLSESERDYWIRSLALELMD